jgi:response regulator NasT
VPWNTPPDITGGGGETSRAVLFHFCRSGRLPSLLRCVINAGMTLRDLTILVIDENAIRASIIEEGLREAGYQRVTVIHEVNGVARTIETLQPDVIFIDLENPNRDMMEHLFQLTRTVGRPIAMFVDRSDTASIEAAVEAGVSAYVVDGLKKERVKPILDMAVSRFNAFSRLQRELADAKSALEERKVIERAKGILMKMRGLSEEEAFALLRQTAMNEKKKISEIAQSVVTAAGLLM